MDLGVMTYCISYISATDGRTHDVEFTSDRATRNWIEWAEANPRQVTTILGIRPALPATYEVDQAQGTDQK